MEQHVKCSDIIKVTTDVEVLKTKISNVEDKMDSLTGIEIALNRLSTIMEYNERADAERQELLKKQTTTLEEQSKTLSQLSAITAEQSEALKRLNEKLDNTDKRVGDLDDKLNRIHKEEQSKWTIHAGDIFQKLFWIIVGIIGTGAATLLLKNLPSVLGN